MDESRMQLAVTLAIIAALVFSLMFVRKFLGVVRLSFRAALVLGLFAVIVFALWSQRFPVESF